jgi:hypothetical protein
VKHDLPTTNGRTIWCEDGLPVLLTIKSGETDDGLPAALFCFEPTSEDIRERMDEMVSMMPERMAREVREEYGETLELLAERMTGGETPIAAVDVCPMGWN